MHRHPLVPTLALAGAAALIMAGCAAAGASDSLESASGREPAPGWTAVPSPDGSASTDSGAGPDTPVIGYPETPSKGLSNGPSGDDLERKKAPAPIESVEIVTRRSAPPQYSVVIVSGVPNGCTAFGGYRTEREGNTFTIEVYNLAPDSDDVICTMIYGMHEGSVDLGVLEAGHEYTVIVNGKATVFTAA